VSLSVMQKYLNDLYFQNLSAFFLIKNIKSLLFKLINF